MEAARGEAEAALRRYQAEEDRYQAAARHLPEARGLTAAGLSQRAEAIEGLLRDLQDLDEEYRALHQVMADHRERRQLREEAAARIAARQAEIADTQRRLGAARQRVRALEERLRDPEMVRLRQDIDALAAEERRLEEAARELAERRQALETKVAASQAQIKTVAPEEAEARAEVAARLQHLRQRLQLHPALADLAAALDRDGPVTTLPRLPRPVESPARLEEEIERRRTALLEFQLQYRDLLSDYRPARAHGGDSLVFYEEREPLTATELLRRLRAREEQYRTYLAEEEQKLYERIIYQGILDDIRKRIRQAHHFTRLTNEKLRQLRLGGEWLSLRLSVASGDEVPGARIARMLEQVDQSSEWLAEEQREALLGLIRAEVERVRQEAAARGEAISYHDAIREALDYRRWYQYQLLSHTRNHPQGVPIRNRGFGTRSQSARAWALAVPVIAGVAARYEASPRPDVPRLIALDEAFAGFDPQNQAAYLKFLCDLNFCWLITCPDELPYSADLSAAMAYRMTLDEEQGLHYGYPILWDGRQVREPLAELADPDSAAEAAADREPAGPGEGEEP
nr:MAG: hypothetical protein DIU70_05680 [Bacillota bacterium]